jgi:sugar phosphate isomerase/epimerase
MLTTRTGKFPIGFRRGWTEWQSDLRSLGQWAHSHGFAHIDLTDAPNDAWNVLSPLGLKIVSADLTAWKELMSADAGKRKAAIVENERWITTAAAYGAKAFFIVMLPENPEAPRVENFGRMVESVAALAPLLEKVGGAMAIEGYPGPGALCCTPETCRALFKEVHSKAIGINYDPSHLIRLGVDHIRFLQEFGSRVVHVHAKDAEIMEERVYELGREQPATFAGKFGFGGATWRYALPGHGMARWWNIFQHLEAIEYAGAVSIELEDCNFNGPAESEKLGLSASAAFLATC